MKILYVITGLNFGGAETQLMRMVRYVVKNTSDEVCVVSLIEPEYQGFVEELGKLKVPFISLNLKKNGNFVYAIRNYQKVLKRFQPDIVHTHMIHANMFARVLRKKNSGYRLINTVHGEEDFLGKRAKLYWTTDRKADYTVCVSKALEYQMLHVKAVSKERVVSLYNGLSTEIYCVKPEIRKEYREKLGLYDTNFNWIIAGRLSPEKNHSNLLEACELLDAENPNWHLLIAGEGVMRKTLEDKISKSEILRDKVQLLGLRSDISALLNASDGFVLSSNYEGLPLVLQEAAAVGLPMVSTDVGGCNEVVLEGKNGYLVEKKNSVALAEAMLMVMNLTEDEQLKLGAASKKLVEEEFSMDQVMKKWYQMYKG